MLGFIWKWHNKRKCAYKRIRQTTFFQSILGSKAIDSDWNFQNVKAWILGLTYATIWWKRKTQKVGVEKQNSKKGFEKNEHACMVEGVTWVLDSTASLYLKNLKIGRPDLENSKLVKAPTVWKWRAEIQDTPLGLTGIGTAVEKWS